MVCGGSLGSECILSLVQYPHCCVSVTLSVPVSLCLCRGSECSYDCLLL